jgi:uncharacterized protein (TIGR03083 family)
VPDALEPLRQSTLSLASAVEGLNEVELTRPAYPTQWTIADTLSHLGSGAVIFEHRLNDVLADKPTAPDYFNSVWDEWNAKTPEAQAKDVVTVDGASIARLDELTDADRERVRVAFGPFEVGYEGYVALRLSEHALHTWDVKVVLDPTSVVAPDAVDVLVDNLATIAQFASKPSEVERTYVVRTSDPERTFAVEVTSEKVTLTTSDADEFDVTLPAEAFVRLVYGRLDPDHTPDGITGDLELDELRKVFAGF